MGNKADVSSNDLLRYWQQDGETQAILLYLESFGNPRAFARVAPLVSATTPIVAVKSGRSVAGSRAAASHTAALASPDAVVDALFHAGRRDPRRYARGAHRLRRSSSRTNQR